MVGHCCLPNKATISEQVYRWGSNSSEEFIKVGNTNLTVTGLRFFFLQRVTSILAELGECQTQICR
jgi:hypothetical protein